ncbi:MAG TPA: hydrolase [Gammaproteobacteria bacterium]|nr:hydrolase [Gammaproteobacteria bacterium]HQY22951.1 hydrolase [Gammaproteobacteria bacterium]HQZ87150.1 hydrolase [Gammaproteobacteria bacterium]HRA42376.1 hydrolase [Gammaproteobacteria bacterium]
MHNSFKPAWWLRNPHLQTLWAALLRPKIKLSICSERLELADGDFLDFACVGNGSGPRVLILHGLNGSIDSPYARGILQAINNRGWRGIFMHFRGCSGEPNRLAQSYHSGETRDLQTVITELIHREPNSPLFAIGYSLGGNVLLKWLGETGESGIENSLKAAVAVSIPFELAKTAAHLKTGFSRLYQWHLLRELSASYHRKFKDLPKPFAIRNVDVTQLKTFWEFDNAITAPLHGFKSADDYYEKSSSRQYLAKIKTPTLILHARNDPFTTLNALPEVHEVSKHVSLELSENGGHVGFVSGKYPWKPVYWLEDRIMDYLESYSCSGNS